MVICLERDADLHVAQRMPLPLTVSCFSKIQIGFPFWYRLTWAVLDKGPLNGCVCVCDMLSVDGGADAAVEARIRIGWNKFRQLVPLLTNKDVSLIMRGRLYYSSCVRSSMLHGSKTWPVRKENVVALQRAEMRMVR